MEVTKINTSIGRGGLRGADFRPVGYCYCLQTKFVKVMFSHVFVCPRGGGLCPEGGSLSRGGVGSVRGISVRGIVYVLGGVSVEGVSAPMVKSRWYVSYWNAFLFVNKFAR